MELYCICSKYTSIFIESFSNNLTVHLFGIYSTTSLRRCLYGYIIICVTVSRYAKIQLIRVISYFVLFGFFLGFGLKLFSYFRTQKETSFICIVKNFMMIQNNNNIFFFQVWFSIFKPTQKSFFCSDRSWFGQTFCLLFCQFWILS